MNIKLSPKHGLNTTIPHCFWCGEPKNEIVILGKIDRKDSPAPRKLIKDYEPCDKCKEIAGEGIRLIGTADMPAVQGMPPIAGYDDIALFPTGTFAIASPEWVVAFLKANNCEYMIDNVLKSKILAMPEEFILDIIDEADKLKETEETENEDN